ncbi:hypothetical protein [Gimesia aquarii]|uniref:Uncharacterized protein n=1 Tax=Gimesia aquarii TaxID=2527964 RepID=A0A517VUM4_9PLAN|nr:hypothetical protein [Gimesia aquarii]QDT96703.1 hypothetical protein V144x_21610 [Gimesia aquarii]
MRYWGPNIILLFLLCVGCSSIKTTVYDRLEDDTVIANPDKHLKGVPVSLKVPTHLELKIEEKTFWRVEGTEMMPVTSCRPTRTVSHDVKYIEKVFLVDPVRPAAGPTGEGVTSNSFGFSFKSDDLSDDQLEKGETKSYEYSGKGQLSGLHYHIEDRTIERSAELLASSLKFLKAFPQTGATVSGGDDKQKLELNVLETTRVIAWSRFDLNSEHFEEDVMGFLDTYLNQKNSDLALSEN